MGAAAVELPTRVINVTLADRGFNFYFLAASAWLNFNTARGIFPTVLFFRQLLNEFQHYLLTFYHICAHTEQSRREGLSRCLFCVSEQMLAIFLSRLECNEKMGNSKHTHLYLDVAVQINCGKIMLKEALLVLRGIENNIESLYFF
jgi:hypothetical protein